MNSKAECNCFGALSESEIIFFDLKCQCKKCPYCWYQGHLPCWCEVYSQDNRNSSEEASK